MRPAKARLCVYGAVYRRYAVHRPVSYTHLDVYKRQYLGSLVERGEYFSGEEELKKTIENVCFNNVNKFFGFNVKV